MKTTSKKELLLSAFLLLLLSALVISGFLIADFIKDGLFSYKVITGALLGSLVAFINFWILSLTVDRVLAKIAIERGTAEMSEEEEKAFVEKYTAQVQITMAKSLGFRMILMIAILVLALLSKQFNVIATVIPLALQKPIIQWVQIKVSKDMEKDVRKA